MEKINRNKLCRLCSSRPQISYSLLEKNGVNILEALTGIKIDSNDGLPTRACLKCWLNLKLAHQIQQNILEVDKSFKSRHWEDCNNEQPASLNPNMEEISLESSEDSKSKYFIKEEHLDIKHTIVNENDEDLDGNTQDFETIKVENLTDDEVLVICHTESTNTPAIGKTDVSKEGPTECHICGEDMQANGMIEHLKTHYCSRLKCEECNTYCENIASYRKHINAKHEDLKRYWMCKICCSSFQYKPLYKIHVEKAHLKGNIQLKMTRDAQKLFTFDDYKYDCPYCKRRFKSEERSLVHIKMHNKKECPICHVKITPSNFKVHVNSHNSQPVVCHLCGVTYKNQTSLRSHIFYTHSTRKYTCSYCKKVFKKAYDLPLHIKKEHTGERDHVCDICGKSFFTFHTLNTHTKMTHMKLRPFQCQYCKKKFSSKHSLTTHERQHTNVTPYNCEVCGEGFRQNVSLRAHKKSKHNIVEEKTCACKVCGKKFGTEWAVLSHMRVH